MYQEKKRERRRRDFLRMKERAKKIQQSRWNYFSFDHTEESLETAACKLANNLQVCSCYMCGNPRKWWNEKTFQEIKADIEFDEQLSETR